MADLGLEQQISDLLEQTNSWSGFVMSLVCTDEGLLVASSGDQLPSEQLAGVTSLFDDIVLRSQRDLGFQWVDEVAMLDPSRGRLVVRPLPIAGSPRFFLVAQVPPKKTWRRATNKLTRELARLLEPLVVA